MVGVERFELPTSCSQSRRATRLRYTPMKLDSSYLSAFQLTVNLSNGAPGRIRTSDPQVRSLVLYPTELRAQQRRDYAAFDAFSSTLAARQFLEKAKLPEYLGFLGQNSAA
jgi:hypothetical protein